MKNHPKTQQRNDAGCNQETRVAYQLDRNSWTLLVARSRNHTEQWTVARGSRCKLNVGTGEPAKILENRASIRDQSAANRTESKKDSNFIPQCKQKWKIPAKLTSITENRTSKLGHLTGQRRNQSKPGWIPAPLHVSTTQPGWGEEEITRHRERRARSAARQELVGGGVGCGRVGAAVRLRLRRGSELQIIFSPAGEVNLGWENVKFFFLSRENVKLAWGGAGI